MNKKAIAALVFLLMRSGSLFADAIPCRDQGGSCPANSGYCVPSYTQTSADLCNDLGAASSAALRLWPLVGKSAVYRPVLT